jgi:hypothetical protein
MVSPLIEKALIWRCLDMVNKRNVCPDSPRSEMAQVVEFSHNRGYLYTNRGANAFVCGYRIPEISDKWKSTIPENEQGEIFFVNFAVSEEPDRWTLLRMLRGLLKDNPDIKELCYYRRNSDKDFKRIHLRRPSNEQ